VIFSSASAFSSLAMLLGVMPSLRANADADIPKDSRIALTHPTLERMAVGDSLNLARAESI
jgi:hypothetical protein